MNAIFFLYVRSIKNRFYNSMRSPGRLIKTLGFACILAMLIVGAATGAIVSAAPAEMPLLQGMMFILFFLPYFAGRYGGIGPFSVENVNFIFTAPILPRTVLLAEVVRRLWDMIVISIAAVTMFSFMGMVIVIEFSHILLMWIFCLALMVVCKLYGLFLFAVLNNSKSVPPDAGSTQRFSTRAKLFLINLAYEYRRIYRWIGFFWAVLLLIAAVIYFAHAGWELLPGVIGLVSSPVFALTPLVGWAAAGAFAFMGGQAVSGAIYTCLLLTAGVYFFWVVYRSAPDFYDEALGTPRAAPLTKTTINGPVSGKSNFHGNGAAVFFDKHLLEESGGWSSKTRISWLRDTRACAFLELVGGGILGGMALAIIWGLYARGIFGNIEIFAMIIRTIGVPSGNILAVLIPSILILAAYPQYDKGFMELYNFYFYLVPDSPVRKLFWVSVASIVNVCAVAMLVLVPAGVVSGTSPAVVLAVILAYFAAAFMVLGLRLAVVRVLGVVSGGQQKLVATLPVLVFVLIGMVGMLAMFYFGPESWGLLVALLGFAGWCGLIGALGFGFSLRVLHDVDAPL